MVSGSIAASIQASMGANVVAGSAFSILQSIGAAGIGKTAVVLAASGAGAGAAVVTDAINDKLKISITSDEKIKVMSKL